MLEFEKKWLLTQAEYEVLKLQFAGNSSTTVQTNYYFDTDDCSMNRQGITCRIRGKNGRYRVTIKNHQMNHDDCSHEATIADTTQFDVSVFCALGLRLQGELITERTLLYEDAFCKAELDKNQFLGCTDYELEIEYAEGHAECVLAVLEQVAYALRSVNEDITAKWLYIHTNAQSKSQRFFERKTKLVEGGGEVQENADKNNVPNDVSPEQQSEKKEAYNPDEYLNKYFCD